MQRPDLAGRFGRMPTWLWFLLALLLQLGIIGSMVVTHYVAATTGTPVLLKIAPVDPRDPLRGDYLMFRYDISTLSRDLFMLPDGAAGWTPARGETVYVALTRQGAYWTASQVLRTLPTRAERDAGMGGYPSDAVFLKGAVTDVGPSEVKVTYGTEQFFVPEGRGTRFPLTKEASALVVVGPDGKALVRQVFVGGRKWP